MRFRILGPLEVFDGTGWVGIRPARCRSLLAALLIRRHEVFSVDQLVLELWGDTAPKTAATQVHGYVMRLRGVLGDAKGRVLVTTSAGYRIERGEHDVDIDVFEAHTDAGRAALRAGRLDEAADALGRALGVWRGAALSDVAPNSLVTAEVHRLTERRLTEWETLAEVDLQRGRHEALISELRRHVAEHPLREQAWRQLMTALDRSGRQAEALQAYQWLHRTLADELGVRPSGPLRELHGRLLAGRKPVDGEPDPGAGDDMAVLLPIGSLVPADSPRVLGEDDDHVRTLAELDAELPPIVVHRPTMRIVDGMHRVKAAVRRGQSVIPARFFDGSASDAFVMSVSHNIAHGLPLSLADRKAAATRIVADHPEWSDRSIAAVAGLAPSTVGTIRCRSTGRDGQLNTRVGRDGRERPVDGTQRRQRVRELIAADPTLSIRQIAHRADVSVGTVHAVRTSMLGVRAHGQDPASVRSTRRDPARSASAEPASWSSLRERLRADPALRYSESGRKLLRWLDVNVITAEEWPAVAQSVPAHWSDSLAVLALRFATQWRAFAGALQRAKEETAPDEWITVRGAGRTGR